MNPRSKFPVIEGIAAAASQIGAPLPLLKAVKKAGSKAFLPGNRVDTAILLPQLFAALAKGSQLPEGISTPADWLRTEQARIASLKRQQIEKELMPVLSALRQMGEAGGFAFSELERMARELPPGLSGLSAVEIGKRLSAEVERIRVTLKQKCEIIEE